MAMPNREKFYVTTPIYYVTARPHLGSLYSTVIADVLARWHKIQGQRVFFLTGTDEHGQKIAKAAAQAGQEPKPFTDSFIPAYKDAWKKFEIDYSFFMRTSDAYHVQAVQKWLEYLIKKGEIYKSFYEGWYCVSDETFVTEDLAKETAPLCPSCGRQTERVAEEAYFFKLSAYQDRLLKFYERNPDFIVPKERAHEVINFVKSGLKDLSISRTTVKWGIPFPGDEKHVTYVWADALNNYITAIGYGTAGKEKEFASWWPANIQVLGKDILRFHAIYWPAFLMAIDVEPPQRLLVHGWITVAGAKMSKSLGNVVDPLILYEKYGADPIRYYLIKQLAITHDGEFGIEDLEQKIGSDLADDLGNLLNRMSTLALKQTNGAVKGPDSWSAKSVVLREQALQAIDAFGKYMQECMFHLALAAVWKFIHQVNTFFHEAEPWKIKDQKQFEEVIAATAESLRTIGLLLWPVMPTKMEQLLAALGSSFSFDHNSIKELQGPWRNQFMITKIEPLFAKPLTEEKPAVEVQPIVNSDPYITIDDFTKVILQVGMIVSAEKVEKSDKLLKLQVDFGSTGKRQVLSGIAKYYAPEDLINKQAVFVTNLAPRMMMGMESQGMLLTAEKSEGGICIVTPQVPVINGCRLK
jgi:methionyl-tRNA synthetase